jgi:hypothetical protein
MNYLKVAAVSVAAIASAGSAMSMMQQDGPRPKLAEAPAPDARYADWAAKKPGQPVQAMVRFDGVTADARVRAILTRHNVRPYSIHMFLENRYGAHTTDPSKASLDIIEAARQQSIGMREAQAKSLQARAKAMLAPDGLADRREIAEALPEIEAQRGRGLNGLRRGIPIVYGARVVGTAEGLRALAGEAGVAAVVPGILGAGDRIGVPTPDAPAAPQRGPAARKSDADLTASLRALAGAASGE